MGHTTKDRIVAILRDLARQIQAMDDDDIDNVLTGKAKLKVGIQGARRPQGTKRSKLPDDELEKLADILRTLTSREEANTVLEGLPSKTELARLARYLDLPVQKSDSAEQLRSRLIESTVGFRLRSAAIQGGVPTASAKPVEPPG